MNCGFQRAICAVLAGFAFTADAWAGWYPDAWPASNTWSHWPTNDAAYFPEAVLVAGVGRQTLRIDASPTNLPGYVAGSTNGFFYDVRSNAFGAVYVPAGVAQAYTLTNDMVIWYEGDIGQTLTNYAAGEYAYTNAWTNAHPAATVIVTRIDQALAIERRTQNVDVIEARDLDLWLAVVDRIRTYGGEYTEAIVAFPYLYSRYRIAGGMDWLTLPWSDAYYMTEGKFDFLYSLKFRFPWNTYLDTRLATNGAFDGWIANTATNTVPEYRDVYADAFAFCESFGWPSNLLANSYEIGFYQTGSNYGRTVTQSATLSGSTATVTNTFLTFWGDSTNTFIGTNGQAVTWTSTNAAMPAGFGVYDYGYDPLRTATTQALQWISQAGHTCAVVRVTGSGSGSSYADAKAAAVAAAVSTPLVFFGRTWGPQTYAQAHRAGATYSAEFQIYTNVLPFTNVTTPFRSNAVAVVDWYGCTAISNLSGVSMTEYSTQGIAIAQARWPQRYVTATVTGAAGPVHGPSVSIMTLAGIDWPTEPANGVTVTRGCYLYLGDSVIKPQWERQ